MKGDPEDPPLSSTGEKLLLTDDDKSGDDDKTKPAKHLSSHVKKIVKQAEEIYKEGGKLSDTLFYTIVLGGNVTVVADVIEYLENNNQSEELSWLLNGAKKHKTIRKAERKCHLILIRLIVFLIMSIMATLLTPIFYLLHGILTTLFNAQKRRLGENIKLPLAFAAYSQDEDMMKLFISKGTCLDHIDDFGNNIFHYIADLSSERAERAIEIFSCLVQFFDDAEIIRQLMVKKRNFASLTAVEYTAKYGSPALLTHMLNHPNLIQHTSLTVSKNVISFGEEDGEDGQSDRTSDRVHIFSWFRLLPMVT